jgi:hypothetical protein
MGNKEKMHILHEARNRREPLLAICKLHLVVVAEDLTNRRTEPRVIEVFANIAVTSLASHASKMEAPVCKLGAFVFNRLRAHWTVV